MIDTLCFDIREGEYIINDPDKFSPSARILEYKPRELCGQRIYPQNILSASKDVYYPQVRLYEETYTRVRRVNLHVECSIPKFLKGENLFSIREEEKQNFALKMAGVLSEMGVDVQPDTILVAPVKKLHIAHNMLMEVPVCMILDELSMASSLKYNPDTQKDVFKNGGECFHIHHKAYELAFYDKVRDIERLQSSDKMAIGEIYNPNCTIYQTYLKEQHCNILRMEYRINTKPYVTREVNSALGRPAKAIVTVGDCFNNALVQQILLKQWQKVEKACFELPVYRRDSARSLAEIMRRNPKKQDAHLWKAAYILQMIAEKGRVFVRNTLASMYGKAKAKIMIEDALAFKFTRRRTNYIAQIGQELKKFTPLTPEVLSKKVIKSRMKLSMDSTKFLTVKQMANILTVTSTTIYRYLKAGKLTFYKFGKEYRVYEKDFKEFLASCKVAKKGGSK